MRFLNDDYARKFFPALVGLVQGLVAFIAYSSWGGSAAGNAWLACAVYFVAASGISLHLTWNGRNSGRSYAMAIVLGFVTAAVALWVWSRMPELIKSDRPHLYLGDDMRTYSYIFAAVILSYVSIAYQQVYQQGGALEFPYQELFRHSWNNFFIILVGAIFTGILWGLIVICSVLFKSVNITIFHDVFLSPQFAFVATPAFLGLGIAIGRDNTQIINTLRNIALSIIKALLPVLAVISTGFVAALPFTGLAPLWATKYASSLTLGVVVIAVIFMNAVFQDGRPELPYRTWLMRVVEALMVLLPVYALIALYSLWLRIAQHGFTPMRVFALTCGIIALLYSAGYAASVFVKSIVWMGAIRRVNVVMSLIVVASAVLLHTPALDPLSISANSQFSMLTEGRVDPKKFDYAQLRFSYGRAGYDKLKELESASGGEDARVVREMVAATWKLGSRWDKIDIEDAPLKPTDILMSPKGGALPIGLFGFIRKNLSGYEAKECIKNRDCMFIALNMDADPQEEYLFIVSGDYNNVRLIDAEAPGIWKQVAEYGVKTDNGVVVDARALLNEFAKGNVKTAARRYRDVRLGGFTIEYERAVSGGSTSGSGSADSVDGD